METGLHERESAVIAKTNKKKFFGALTAGFLFFGILAGVFGLSGVGYAMPMAGFGDFYVEFDKLEGEGFNFYPKLGETSSADGVPQGSNEIDKATITGLKLYKEFKVGGETIRVMITSDKPVRVTGLIQDASDINMNAKFTNIEMAEHNTGDWQKQFSQTATQIVLSDAKIKTHYLFQKTITMDGMRLTVERQ